MKKYLIFLLFLLLIFTGCGNKTEGELVLVTEAGFAPFEYYSNGKVVGVDIEIGEKIAERLNKKLVVKDIAFSSIISEIKTEKSDIGAAGISYTEERAQEVNFTVDYAVSKQIIIVKKDSNIKQFSDINGKVAVQLGTVADDFITESYPHIELIREKQFIAAIEDLKGNKVQAVVMDELPAKKLINEEMIILDEILIEDSYGMVINKNNKELLDVANEVINELKSDGLIDEMIIRHYSKDSNQKETSFKDRIYNSLIRDGRYKYILEGLKNTVLMSVGAIVIGIFFGSLLAVIRNYYENTKKLRILNFLSKVYINIIRGTPSILQLMIIYYIIFSSKSINIVLVGILAFGINSSAYVAEIVRAGINSVDKGQKEAGFALGLGYYKVMQHIIFPQAIKNILPALGNEFITLVKETAVGAYIGIVELTKASDIIASRTYEYFLPLILIALIYLSITFSLSRLVNYMEKRLNNVKN